MRECHPTEGKYAKTVIRTKVPRLVKLAANVPTLSSKSFLLLDMFSLFFSCVFNSLNSAIAYMMYCCLSFKICSFAIENFAPFFGNGIREGRAFEQASESKKTSI